MENWQENARIRVRENYLAGNAIVLWETLRVPDNKVSRAAARELDETAPTVSATVSCWRDWLHTKFPALAEELSAREEKRLAESTALSRHYQKQRELNTATDGPRWNYNGTVYSNALEFIKALAELGFKPEKTGIGTVRMINADSVFIGPMRNKYINAAVAYLELNK